jgi:exopolyphosphatase/guanosine-5'-triphosphate,3'-diphosphate pyrophosphatase
MGQPPSRTVAAVDIGSNSVHMTLARVHADGNIELIDKIRDQARLGAALDERRRLTDGSIDRTVETLRKFRQMADAHGAAIRATATAAVRGARNRRDFVRRARNEAGVDVDVLSGHNEAVLMYRGVRHGLPHLASESLLCVDVGGASTEVLLGREEECSFVTSVRVGSLTVSRAHLTDPVTPEKVAETRRVLARRFRERLRPLREREFHHAVATSGTIQRLVRLHRGITGAPMPRSIDGAPLTDADLERIIDALSACRDQASRLALPGIDPDRADTLLGGALIFEAIGRRLAISRWTVSLSALRTGLILDAANAVATAS